MKGQTEPRRRRLTYANVVATLALLIAISGGTAFAASKLITGKPDREGDDHRRQHQEEHVVLEVVRQGRAAERSEGRDRSSGPDRRDRRDRRGRGGRHAIAYGAVVINSVGNPVLQSGAVGFTSVTSPGANEYCLNLPANVNGVYPVLSNLGGGNTAKLTIPAPEQCPGGLEVGNPSGTGADERNGLLHHDSVATRRCRPRRARAGVAGSAQTLRDPGSAFSRPSRRARSTRPHRRVRRARSLRRRRLARAAPSAPRPEPSPRPTGAVEPALTIESSSAPGRAATVTSTSAPGA